MIIESAFGPCRGDVMGASSYVRNLFGNPGLETERRLARRFSRVRLAAAAIQRPARQPGDCLINRKISHCSKKLVLENQPAPFTGNWAEAGSSMDWKACLQRKA